MYANLFWRYLAHTSLKPLAFEIYKAKGCYLYNRNYIPYLDCISGISVSNLGHSNKKILKSIIKQLKKYSHTMVYGEHIQKPQVLLAKKLIKITNKNFEKVYFTNSGAESVDLALKLSLLYTNKQKIVAFYGSYHGSTLAATSLRRYDNYSYFNFLKNEIIFLRYNDENELERIDKETACVIVEPIQSESGYIKANNSFLQKLREICNYNNALLIFDESQSGLGRTGFYFAYQYYNIVPDILIVAKALGGGLPLGAVLSSSQIFSVISEKHPLIHLTTFGGNPICCSASLAAIDLLEKLLPKISKKEKLFRKYLKHNLINNINGIGLMLGIEFSDPNIVTEIIKHCYDNYILVDWFLFNNKSIRICPPLIIKEKEIKKVCQTIISGLNNISFTQ